MTRWMNVMLASLPLLTACGGADMDSMEQPAAVGLLDEVTGEAEQSLSVKTGGPQLYDLNQATYPFTVRITIRWSDGSSGICSGAVLGSHTIITAAHCTRNYGTNPPRTPTAATTIHYGTGWTNSQPIVSATEGVGWWESTATDVGLFRVANAINVTKPAFSGSPQPINSIWKMRGLGRMRNRADYTGNYTITSDRNVDGADASYSYFNVAATDPGDSGGPWLFNYTTSAGQMILGGVTSGTTGAQDRVSKTSQAYAPILSKAAAWGDTIPTYVLPPAGCETMAPGEGLAHNQAVWSCDGRFEFRFQSDSNLVLYKHSGGTTTPIWASGTWNMNADKLIMQEDGNLVMYRANGSVVWATHTNGSPNSRLRVQNDGNVVIYNTSNQPIYSTLATLSWSSTGPISGKHCTQISETMDPATWDDNYLCSTENHGFAWSGAGPIGGMRCTQIHEAAEPSSTTWHDNYLCVPNDSPLQLTWSSAGPISGKACVQWIEAADPHTWHDNYLCY